MTPLPLNLLLAALLLAFAALLLSCDDADARKTNRPVPSYIHQPRP